MANTPNWSDDVTEYLSNYGQDYENSLRSEVKEIYGPKFQAMHSDADVRLAFGRSYAHAQEDGTLRVETRYDFAVYMPVETARTLASFLTNWVAEKDAAKAAGG